MLILTRILPWLIIGAILAIFLALEPFVGLRHRLLGGGGDSRKREEERLVGKHGTTATPLRPAGFVTIDGARHAAKAVSGFLDAGVAVTVCSADPFALEVVAETREKTSNHTTDHIGGKPAE